MNIEPDIKSIRAALTVHMDRTGLKGRELCKVAGIGQSAVRDLMSKVEDPRIGTLYRLAAALNVSPATLFGGNVELAGRIDGNGEIHPFSEDEDDIKIVSRPADAVGELIAYVVEGHGLMPAYRDGDIIYCGRLDAGNVADCIGHECAMQLAGSGALIFRTLAKGSRPGTYTLRRWNGPDLEDLQLAWLAPVQFIARRPVTASKTD